MCKNLLVHHHNGRFPAKSAKHVLGLLNNLKSNAEAQSLDPEKCVITHVCTQRAVSGRRRTYRAHGRISPYLSSNCHVEFHVTEKADQVERADKGQVRVTKKQAAKNRLAIGKWAIIDEIGPQWVCNCMQCFSVINRYLYVLNWRVLHAQASISN